MSKSDVSFAVFDALLQGAGFARVQLPDDVFRYVHEDSDTDVLVRIRDMRAAVPWGTFVSTRKILDGRGVLADGEFDRRVAELERTLGTSASAANGAAHSTGRQTRTRRGRRRVGAD